jgi:hypothetical protein
MYAQGESDADYSYHWDYYLHMEIGRDEQREKHYEDNWQFGIPPHIHDYLQLFSVMVGGEKQKSERKLLK